MRTAHVFCFDAALRVPGARAEREIRFAYVFFSCNTFRPAVVLPLTLAINTTPIRFFYVFSLYNSLIAFSFSPATVRDSRVCCPVGPLPLTVAPCPAPLLFLIRLLI